MNEQILELAKQVWPDPNISHVNHMKFAELIIAQCIKAVEDTAPGYPDYRSQIEEAMRSWCVRSIKDKFGVE